MKRTNLVLDEELLKKVTLAFRVKTYSEAVNRSLLQSLKDEEAKGLLKYNGSNIWDGDLSEMRDPKKKKKMILYDTSAWIEIFSKKGRLKLDEKRLKSIAICPVVIQEILQGIKDDRINEDVRH